MSNGFVEHLQQRIDALNAEINKMRGLSERRQLQKQRADLERQLLKVTQ